MFLMVPVLATLAKMSLLAAGAEVDRHAGGEQQPPRVTVSSPVPPVMVSVLATVTVLAKLPRVRLSLPVPRSIEALLSAAPRVTVSLPVPPVMVSVLATVAAVGAVGESEGVAAGAEIDRAVGDGGAEGDGVRAGAADQGLNVADGAGVAAGGQGELVGAGAEVDATSRWSARCRG